MWNIVKMDLEKVISKIDDLVWDHSMPKRIKVVLERVGNELKNESQDVAVRVTSVIYELEDVANDINIPTHAKTALWDLVSSLEAIKHEGD